LNYHDYKDKDVLLIGSNTFTEAACALEHGAALVETVPGKPGGESDLGKLLGWPGRVDWAAGGNVQVRHAGVAGTTLEDEDAWDNVVISGVGQAELPEVMQRAQRAVRPLGQVMLHKTAVDWDDWSQRVDRPAPVAELPDKAERRVMLHVHNVRRCGGTGNFVYDMASCFDEFEHVAVCVNDPAGDPRWIADVQNVMRTMYAPQISEKLLDEINPRVVVLHATSGCKLEGEWPYPWLQGGGKRFVIRLHHIPTRPILPADLSVFVSEYVKRRYAAFVGKQITRHIVLPPGTDMRPYARSPLRNTYPKVATTGGKACASWDTTPPGRVGQFANYLARFPFAVVWSGHQETWCRTVSEALAAGCVVIAHRAGAIPEQIKHGENGYLFSSGAELVEILRDLAKAPSELLTQRAKAGREFAVKIVGFDLMKRALYPYLTEALMEA
jgi:glycosyltransferase involved in cell wall biosynthesis